MDTPRQVREFLNARPTAHFDPEPYRGLRAELLQRPPSEVLAAFEPLLSAPDEEERCRGIEGLVLLYGSRAVESILPRTEDPSPVVRWVVCGCLHDVGDERSVAALLDRMTHDGDVQVRGTAAYALGGVGAIATLPHLHAVATSDFEVDELGHTPASQAAEAMTSVLRRWTIRRIAGDAPTDFEEATATGRLHGKVVAESIPFDPEGRIFRAPRYAHVPISAFGPGWSSKLDLQTTLIPPFEIDVRYEDATCVVRRIFVYRSIEGDAECDWAVYTIVDPAAANLPDSRDAN